MRVRAGLPQLALAPLARCHPRARGLVGWWPIAFTGAITAYDASRSKYHGTLTTSAAWAWNSELGGHLELPLGGHVVLASTMAALSGNVHTFAAWVRLDAGTDADPLVFSTDTGGTVFWQVNFENNTMAYTSLIGGDIGASTWNDGVWRHLVWRVNGASGAEFYVNGLQVTTAAGTGESVATGAKTMHLGKYTGSTVAFRMDGGLADVRIYMHLLSATEIWSLYAEPSLEWAWAQDVLTQRTGAAAVAGRTTRNTHPWQLGINLGMHHGFPG